MRVIGEEVARVGAEIVDDVNADVEDDGLGGHVCAEGEASARSFWS